MKRYNTLNLLNNERFLSDKQKIAYHEAGHATAIHFNNRQKNLPPVFFQIIFKEFDMSKDSGQFMYRAGKGDYIAKVKGGRLIQTLPIPLDCLERKSSVGKPNKNHPYEDDYRLALEADIVNLLIGPLAEAKYVALMDDEPFHPQLLPVPALKNYGGEDDLAMVNDYLESYSADKHAQDKILNQLFLEAFNFVNEHANWKAIARLANYLVSGHKNLLTFDEATAILDCHQNSLSW